MPGENTSAGSASTAGGLSLARVKIGVCIPLSNPWVACEWALAFRRLKLPPGSHLFFDRSHMPIDRVRNNLVEEALKEGCTHVLFLDSDIILEPDSVLRLLWHRFPIVSGVYPDRGGRGNAWKDGKNCWVEKGSIIVDECGMGCCLIDSRVFERVPAPWLSYDYDSLHAPEAPSEDISFCLPPFQNVRTDFSSKPISEMEIGDKVITHWGTSRKVVNKFSREYNGSLAKITPAYGLPIWLTEEHPILVSRYVENGKFLRVKSHLRHYSGELVIPLGNIRNLWVPAKDVRTTDLVFMPKPPRRAGRYKTRWDLRKYNRMIKGPNPNLLPNYVEIDQDLMFLLGLYISEGGIGRQSSITNANSSLLERAREIIGNKFNLNARFKDIHLIVDSRAFGNFLREKIGEKARGKKFPQSWTQLTDKCLAALIKGCWVGDGSLYPPSVKTLIQYNTTSPILARQIHQALLKLNILGSLVTNERGYSITLPSRSQPRFLKVMGWENKIRGSNHANWHYRETGRGFWIRVKSTTKVPYKGLIYNLEIETPNTFNADGIAIHNCRKAGEYGFKPLVVGEIRARHVFVGALTLVDRVEHLVV